MCEKNISLGVGSKDLGSWNSVGHIECTNAPMNEDIVKCFNCINQSMFEDNSHRDKSKLNSSLETSNEPDKVSKHSNPFMFLFWEDFLNIFFANYSPVKCISYFLFLIFHIFP